MSTTSKLGADMLTDEEIFAIADDNDSGRAISGRRLFSERNLLLFARALLARQPAAIDKEAVAEYRRGVKEAFHLANMINANRQGRTAEETCSYLVRSLATLANGGEAPAAPSVEQDERGAFEVHFKKNALDFTMGVDAWDRPIYAHSHIEALWAGWQARAASTSANVAQGAEAVAYRDFGRLAQYFDDIGDPHGANVIRTYRDNLYAAHTERPVCVDCGDTIMAHEPGTCGTCHAMKYAATVAPAVDAQPVGVAGTMPGTDGFTMAAFKASEVPVGTPLYAFAQSEGLRKE